MRVYFKKALSTVVLFFYIFSAFPVFAIEGDSAPSVPAESIATQDTAPVEEVETVETPATEEALEVSDSQAMEGAGAPASIDPIDPANSVAEFNTQRARTVDNVNVEGATGALDYVYTFDIPKGRNGMEPTVSINYSSQRDNYENIVGFGWELSIPKIERRQIHGVNKLYTEHLFTSSLSGELLAKSVDTDGYGTYVPRTETGDFTLYTYKSDGSWSAQTKTGQTYVFGLTSNARQTDPNNATHVSTWFVERVEDTNKNFVRYTYLQDSAQVYPAHVYYTGNGTTDGIFRIDFTWDDRADALEMYDKGYQVKTKYYLEDLRVFTQGTMNTVYAFSYTTGDNTIRSMLSRIQKSTYDAASNELVFPPTTFAYGTNDEGWTLATDVDFPPIFEDHYGNSENWTIVDVNGDSLDDVLDSHYQDTSYISRGTGMDWDMRVLDVPGIESRSNEDTGTRFADVNADMYTDVINSKLQLEPNGITLYLDSREYILDPAEEAWDELENGEYNVPVHFVRGYPGYDPTGGALVDVNGDGLVDALQAHDPSSASDDNRNYVKTFLHTGTPAGWVSTTVYLLPGYLSYMDGRGRYKVTGNRFWDRNKDGLVDFGGNINYGQGTWENIPSVSIYPSEAGERFFEERHFDVNGDGVDDIARGQWSGNPDMQQLDVTFYDAAMHRGEGAVYTLPENYIYFNRPAVQVFDVNGDTLLDIVSSIEEEDQACCGTHQELRMFLKNGDGHTDRLKEVQSSLGAKTTIEYGHSAQERNPDGSAKHPNLPVNIRTVKKITTDNGVGDVFSTSYAYEGGAYYYNSPVDKKFAGFATVTKIDADGDMEKTYFHQGNSNATADGEIADHPSKIGRAYRVDYLGAGDRLMKRVFTTWQVSQRTDADALFDAYFVYSTADVTLDFDGNADHKDSAVVREFDTATGNLLSEDFLGEVQSTVTGVYTDIGTDATKRSYVYVTAQTPYLVGLLGQQTQYTQQGAMVARDVYLYDNSSVVGVATKGNQTRVSKLVMPGNTWVSESYGYNTYGLVIRKTDARSNSTNYTYASPFLYPSTVSNALGHIESFTYDYALGVLLTQKNSNGFTTTHVYDSSGREIGLFVPDPTTGVSTRLKTVTYVDAQSPRYTEQVVVVDGVSIRERTYVDGFGQVIARWLPSEDGYAVTEYWHNNEGALVRQSLPRTESASFAWTGRNTQVASQTMRYDSLGRVIQETKPVGTTNYVYDNWSQTITNARGYGKVFTTDAFGRLTRVIEKNSGASYTTTYSYDTLGNLLKITDPQGNYRAFTYDSLSRLLTQEDLHAPTVTTTPVWTYTYDTTGNKVSQVDPKSQRIVWTYDALNRIKTENWGGGAVEVTYTYDTALRGIGLLAQVQSPSSTLAYTYNTHGTAATEQRTIEGVSATVGFTRDLLGREKGIDYPAPLTDITYTYNAGGRIETISGVVHDFDYAPNGQVSYVAYANGNATTQTFLPENNYRLSRKVTTGKNSAGTAGNIQDLTYTYDTGNNIIRIDDASNTQTKKRVDYTYDDLDRLLTASSTNFGVKNYKVQYTYNALGNLTSNSQIGALTYSTTGAAHPHAVVSAQGKTYTYDKNGNVKSIGPKSFTWTVKNEMAASGKMIFLYDASGMRIKATNTGTGSTTLYFNKYVEGAGAGTYTAYIWAGDTRIGYVNGGVTSITHTDHLGGTTHVADATGKLVEVFDYMPHGNQVVSLPAGTKKTRYSFSNKELQDGVGIYYFDARWMDPAVGQFISVDPMQRKDVVSLLRDPQSFNAYAYARNNPIVMSDPDGELAFLIPVVAVIWVVAEVGLSAYDVYDAGRTLANPDASGWEKAASVGGLAMGLVGPGGGYGVGTKALVRKADDVVDAVRAVEKVADDIPTGSFSLLDRAFENYPAGVPKPPKDAVYRFRVGEEYREARNAADKANKTLKNAYPENKNVGLDVHEIQQVNWGGSATDLANKTVLPYKFHRGTVTPWWGKLQKTLESLHE